MKRVHPSRPLAEVLLDRAEKAERELAHQLELTRKAADERDAFEARLRHLTPETVAEAASPVSWQYATESDKRRWSAQAQLYLEAVRRLVGRSDS
jgi:hypothetical protein